MCYDIYSLWNLTGYLEGGIFILRINCLVYVQIFCNLKGKNKGLLQADSTQKKKKFDISFTDIKGTESALS